MGDVLKTYAKHLAIAWPGLWIATFAIGATTSATPLKGAFAAAYDAPYFAFYGGVGVLAGLWFNRGDRSLVACLVWLPPLLLLALAFYSDYRTLSGGWTNAWATYFTNNCSSAECLGELFATIPFVTCSAYSVGAWWARRRGLAGGRAVPHMSSDGSQA